MPQDKTAETPVPATSADQPSVSQQAETPAGGQAAQTTAKKEEGQSIADLEATLTKALNPIVGRLTKLEQRTKGKGVKSPETQFTFQEREPEALPSKDEVEIANERELLKVEKGITRIIRDTRYQKLLESDTTLAEILENNPLALLKDNPMDAEDALTSIIGILDEKVSKVSVLPNQVKTEVPESVPTNPPQTTVKVPDENKQGKTLKTPDDVGKNIADRMMGR